MWTYNTQLEWSPGTEQATSRCEGKPDLTVNPPPEFGGQEDIWSPEDALVSAVESCLLLSILFFVNRLKVGMTGYKSAASGTMERTPDGLRFTKLEVAIDAQVAGEDDVDKMRQAVERAEAACPVSQALKIPASVTLNTTVG